MNRQDQSADVWLNAQCLEKIKHNVAAQSNCQHGDREVTVWPFSADTVPGHLAITESIMNSSGDQSICVDMYAYLTDS